MEQERNQEEGQGWDPSERVVVLICNFLEWEIAFGGIKEETAKADVVLAN